MRNLDTASCGGNLPYAITIEKRKTPRMLPGLPAAAAFLDR